MRKYATCSWRQILNEVDPEAAKRCSSDAEARGYCLSLISPQIDADQFTEAMRRRVEERETNGNRIARR